MYIIGMEGLLSGYFDVKIFTSIGEAMELL